MRGTCSQLELLSPPTCAWPGIGVNRYPQNSSGTFPDTRPITHWSWHEGHRHMLSHCPHGLGMSPGAEHMLSVCLSAATPESGVEKQLGIPGNSGSGGGGY